MIALGIRVEPKKIHYAIFDAEKDKFINVEPIVVPKALSIPEALKYIRNNILDLIEEYDIALAGIRVTENNAQKTSIDRLYIEGVLLETFASNNRIKYKSYILSQLASSFNCKAKDLKEIRDKNDSSIELEGLNFEFSEFSKNEREAMFVSVAIAREFQC